MQCGGTQRCALSHCQSEKIKILSTSFCLPSVYRTYNRCFKKFEPKIQFVKLYKYRWFPIFGHPSSCQMIFSSHTSVDIEHCIDDRNVIQYSLKSMTYIIFISFYERLARAASVLYIQFFHYLYFILIFYVFFFNFTLHPALGILRHFVPHFLPNFRGIAF